MKNIYTILKEIKYEDKIKSIMKTLRLKEDDEFLLQQGVFTIVQEFYNNVLDEDRTEKKNKLHEVEMKLALLFDNNELTRDDILNNFTTLMNEI